MPTMAGTTRVFLAVQPVDLRGSFDRLYGEVAEVLPREDPRSGHWYPVDEVRLSYPLRMMI